MGIQCIICEKPLRRCLGDDQDDPQNPPGDATVWHTRGNFGSTIIDCDRPGYLECFICDECLAAKAVHVIEVTPHKKVTYTVEPFKLDRS